MTRNEYIDELTRRLAALPEPERRDAVAYYEEYFDAAGPEKEQETIRELGTPAEVAHKVLEGAGYTAGPEAAYAAQLAMQEARRRRTLLIAVVLLAGAVLLTIGMKVWAAQNRGGTAYAAVDRATDGSGYAVSVAVPEQAPDVPALPEWSEGTDYGQATGELATVEPGQDLDIDLNVADVVVAVDPDATQLTVWADQAEEYGLIVKFRDNHWQISTDQHSRPADGDTGPVVTVSVPSYWNARLEISLGMGSVSVDDLQGVRELSVEVGMGNVDIGALACTELEVETGTGNLYAGSITATEAKLCTAMGDIYVLALTATEADLEAVGGITVEQLDAKEIEVECGMGDVLLTLAGAQEDYAFEGECGMGQLSYGGQILTGKVELNKKAARKIELECGMGSADVVFDGGM